MVYFCTLIKIKDKLIITMKKIYLVTCLIMFAVFQAQIVNIPDPYFKSLLISDYPYMAKNLAGENTVIDTNNDGEIQVSEAENISKLDFNSDEMQSFANLYNNIISMVGIKSFTNLTELNIDKIPLLESIDISNNTLLYRLNISRCYVLSSVNIQGCSQLYDLDIFFCKIITMDLSGLSNLYEVNMTQCQLNNLYFYNNTNLKNLVLVSNSLQNLTLNQTPNLKDLTIAGNQLSTFNFSAFPNLETLNCTYNKFVTIDLSQNSRLKYFACDMNPNLQFLLIKNGINNFTQNNSTFSNTPNLHYICADESEIQQINNQLSTGSNCTVNSYCSFTPGGINYSINGNTKYDSNNNGCDANDLNIGFQKFSITNGTVAGSMFANSTGNYSIAVTEGSHTITPILENSTYFTVFPTSLTASFPTQASPLTQNFCITANGTHNDLEVLIIPVTAATPGFNAKYKIVYKNKGTAAQSGTLSFHYNDNLMNYLSSTLVPNSQSTGLLNWNFTNLAPFETREITTSFTLNTPTQTPGLNGGDILHYTAQVNGTTDETPSDNTFTLNQTVVNSFDPNDKTCLEGTSITQAKVGDYVHYLIRFENTGTANAQNIVVKDDIDVLKYDISSLVALNGSHNFVTRITGNTVEFIFENIQLPFANTNNDGYVSFKIKTKSTLNIGDSFSNTAKIYFDYNHPIITNTYTTNVQNNALATSEISNDNSNISIYPNPVKDVLNIQSKNEIIKAEIYDATGRILHSASVKANAFNVSDLPKGNYIIKLSAKDKTFIQKFIKN